MGLKRQQQKFIHQMIYGIYDGYYAVAANLDDPAKHELSKPGT